MFFYQKSFLPEHFNSMFSTNSEVHSNNTGENIISACITVERTLINSLFNFKVKAVYNFLNDEIKEASSITSL